MSVLVRFMQSGAFHAAEFLSIDPGKISRFQISHQRTTCELLVNTPENPRPNIPYMIARMDNVFQIKAILKDLQQLKQGNKNIIYDISDNEVNLIQKI